MKGLLILMLVLASSLLFYQSASASSWTGSPFEGKLPPQDVNKSTMEKSASWLKRYGSANAPVCGIKLCGNTPVKAFSFDGHYFLKQKP